MDEMTRALRERTGLAVVGCYAFGSGPSHADELLAFVTRGTKRATAGALVELDELDDPFPEVGQLWGLLDGAGEPRYVAETVDVVAGKLGEVTPAFAWDEGEDDRTYESWLEGHRAWGASLLAGGGDTEAGGSDAGSGDGLPVVFERFRIVWPQPDTTTWWAAGVRELSFDERAWLASRPWVDGEVDVAGERWRTGDLPALVHEHDGRRDGVLAFRPSPGGRCEVSLVAVEDGLEGDGRAAVVGALLDGLAAIGRTHGWVDVPGAGPARR